MKNIRLIPRLDIKGTNVVKPIQTEALRVVGNPEELALKYYQQGADELIYLDIVASLYQRNLDYDLLKSVAKNIFIPLTVGGGIRSINDINNVLRAGADKIAINTFALRQPTFLAEAVKKFGSQCIVIYVEAKKVREGQWEAYTDGGREKTGVDVVNWLKKAIKLGVGEILITSVDRDGTRKGFETDLIKKINSFSPIPVIAHGGAGSRESIKDVIINGQADAVAAASIFHYNDFSLLELKKYLFNQKINVRLL